VARMICHCCAFSSFRSQSSTAVILRLGFATAEMEEGCGSRERLGIRWIGDVTSRRRWEAAGHWDGRGQRKFVRTPPQDEHGPSKLIGKRTFGSGIGSS
jgi:hypothetical protein